MKENKLPEIEELRKGSVVYVIENCKLKAFYDDFSECAEISSVKRWRVEIYDKITKRELSPYICMKNGLYPSLERAVYEVSRFRERGENLIFYLLPIGLAIDKKKLFKHLWGDNVAETGIATDEEMQEEAKKRLYFIKSKPQKGEIDIYKKFKQGSETLKAFDEAIQYLNWKILPYEVTENGLGVLYVTCDKEKWQAERPRMEQNGDGIVPACIYGLKDKEVSFENIRYKYKHGKIWRAF